MTSAINTNSNQQSNLSTLPTTSTITQPPATTNPPQQQPVVNPVSPSQSEPIFKHTLPQINNIWGNHSRDDLFQIVNSCYEEIVFFRKNLFLLPSGKAGKDYIN